MRNHVALESMAAGVRSLARRDAAERFAELIEKAAN
jgi:UDP-N-acetylglucosamine:LPS N-acetylglucosamine transferase